MPTAPPPPKSWHVMVLGLQVLALAASPGAEHLMRNVRSLLVSHWQNSPLAWGSTESKPRDREKTDMGPVTVLSQDSLPKP